MKNFSAFKIFLKKETVILYIINTNFKRYKGQCA